MCLGDVGLDVAHACLLVCPVLSFQEYVGDSPEGLDKRALLLEPDMLGEFDYKRAKYRVVVYDEPVTLVAQWMEDGTWRLLKSVEAELVEDAAAYQQLQVRD
jgi:hypothetical protein